MFLRDMMKRANNRPFEKTPDVECPICEHCNDLSWELLPVLFGNGIEDVACKECIKAWEDAFFSPLGEETS